MACARQGAWQSAIYLPLHEQGKNRQFMLMLT